MKGKKIKGISPLEGLASTLLAMKDSIDGRLIKDKSNIFRTEKDSWIVDTCIPSDTEVWETGISQNKGDKWTIIEQYKDKKEAKRGHQKWVKIMTKNPEVKLEDINVWE